MFRNLKALSDCSVYTPALLSLSTVMSLTISVYMQSTVAKNHLVANCFTHNLLSLKWLSQTRQDDDTLRKPRARTSVSSPPISLRSCQKCREELPAKCFIAADYQIELCNASHSGFDILDWCQQETGFISCTQAVKNICNPQYICNL